MKIACVTDGAASRGDTVRVFDSCLCADDKSCSSAFPRHPHRLAQSRMMADNRFVFGAFGARSPPHQDLVEGELQIMSRRQPTATFWFATLYITQSGPRRGGCSAWRLQWSITPPMSGWTLRCCGRRCARGIGSAGDERQGAYRCALR